VVLGVGMAPLCQRAPRSAAHRLANVPQELRR
jgi:hypothetical protein